MNRQLPYTPFSTRLSGSARETELRIQNIVTGPKKRPPIPFLILMFSVCLLCGNLVSCQMAEAETPEGSTSIVPDSSASVPANGLPAASGGRAWLPATLDTSLMQYIGQTGDWWAKEYYPTQEEMALLEDLPARELPREAVNINNALRKDYWRDTLLPVVYDEAEDVTVYLAFNPDSIPDKEPGAGLPWWAPDQQRGIVLRHGDRAVYFHLFWDFKYSGNPPLLVDDFDGDGQPEAAVVLSQGGGTGVYTESLYIFDLDTMTCSIPDCLDIPLEITYDPDKDRARMVSGDKEWPVRLDDLGLPFEGEVAVGNIVDFSIEDGQILCELTPDFTCSTTGYVAYVQFPVIYENGVYKLGPAVHMGDIL